MAKTEATTKHVPMYAIQRNKDRKYLTIFGSWVKALDKSRYFENVRLAQQWMDDNPRSFSDKDGYTIVTIL